MQTSWVFDHMVKGTGEASRSSWPTGTEMGGGTVVDGTWSSGVLRPRSTLLSRSSGPGGAVDRGSGSMVRSAYGSNGSGVDGTRAVT